MLTRVRLASVLAACLVLICGCTSDDPGPVAQATPTPTPTPPASTPASASPTISPVDPQVVKGAVATVQRYLDVWAARGLVAAGRYVVPRERAGLPEGQELESGGVIRHELVSWAGPDHFTLDVWMTLTAENVTDPFQARLVVSANQHPHRIAVSRTPDGRYLLSFRST